LHVLQGKKLVITGVATKDSIAFAIAREAQMAGAELVLTSFGRVASLTRRSAARLPDPPDVLELDVDSPEDFEALTAELRARFGHVDGAVHAIAYAPPDALGGHFVETSAVSAMAAVRISAFSLAALSRALIPVFRPAPSGASIVGLDFDASVAWPSYDWMGVSKAALESVNRYLARDLGALGARVNLLAAGPLRTVAARSVPGFEHLTGLWERRAPLGWDASDATPVAKAATFLLSDAARGITGEILHVDGGFHAIGTELPDAERLAAPPAEAGERPLAEPATAY
jgi:meromycolic acid enoyl-[acyl-carrier protein] reductase